MKKIKKFFKSFLFILFWLALSNYLQKYWNILHWEFIFLKGRMIFDYEFWYLLKKNFFGIDSGYYLEELFKFSTYEIPKESFKFIPIYFFLKTVWIKNKS